VSREDKLEPHKFDLDSREAPAGDDRLQIDLRLRLDEVAAAEEERLRATPRKRPGRRELVDLALKLYDARRGRDRMFSDRLFGEPAWDMLLALYALPNRGIILGVTSLAHAANVPPTTSLRWQKLLADEGLIERGPHVRDARQRLVRLSAKGKSLMDRYMIKLFYCDGRSVTDTDPRRY